MKKWLFKLRCQVVQFFKSYAEEVRKSNYVSRLEGEVYYLRELNKKLSEQLSAQANLLQVKEELIKNYMEMERHLQKQIANSFKMASVNVNEPAVKIIAPTEKEWPCKECEEGEMNHKSTHPPGIEIYECTHCGHEERYP